jgi:hypothetical protein
MFEVGNFIKENTPGSQQWKVMRDNGIWYEILNCQKHWSLVAEDDTIKEPKKKKTYRLRKHA